MTESINDFLGMMRVRGTAYLAKNLSAPWGVYIDEHPGLSRFHIVVSGTTWVGIPGTDETHKLDAGDIAIIPRGKEHSYFDRKDQPIVKTASFPSAKFPPRFEIFDKESANTHLLCGYFEMSKYTPPIITSQLPDLLVRGSRSIRNSRQFELIIELAREELSKPAKEVSRPSLDRLTELLCFYTIQDWMREHIDIDEPFGTLIDPKTKMVLDNIHATPEAEWNLKALAQLTGQSRSAFTSHFKQATGVSPMNYVRKWRLRRASQMLEEGGLSIDEIAFKSGYADTNAFSRAFKREIGMSPGIYKTSDQQSVG